MWQQYGEITFLIGEIFKAFKYVLVDWFFVMILNTSNFNKYQDATTNFIDFLFQPILFTIWFLTILIIFVLVEESHQWKKKIY